MTAPRPVCDASAWSARDCAPGSWIHTLSPPMVDEIEDIVRGALRAGIEPSQLSPERFPLAIAAPLLDAAHADLEDGRGFSVVRGWPAHRHDYRANLTAFCGIASHLGRIMVQNYEGDRHVDVTDAGKPYSHTSRGYQGRARLPFHTDGADLAALLCLATGARGGESVLVSASRVYNVLVSEQPQWLPRLERGFFHHRRGQHHPDEHPLSSHRVPVFSFHHGHLHCCYNRNPIDWAQKEGVRIEPQERAALDFFDAVVARPEMQLRLDFRPGDIQLVNNHVVLHSRGAYEDDGAARRHLVRLWLEDPRSKRGGENLLDLYVPGTSRHSRERAPSGT